MYICLCRGVTDRQIRRTVQQGAARMRDLHRELGVCSQCGKCARHARDLLCETLRDVQAPSGRLAGAVQAAVLPAAG